MMLLEDHDVPAKPAPCLTFDSISSEQNKVQYERIGIGRLTWEQTELPMYTTPETPKSCPVTVTVSPPTVCPNVGLTEPTVGLGGVMLMSKMVDTEA